MSHIVDSCQLTKLAGGLSKLHSADDDAVAWPILITWEWQDRHEVSQEKVMPDMQKLVDKQFADKRIMIKMMNGLVVKNAELNAIKCST